MIVHLFNSSSVSGPERLVLPALAQAAGRFMVVNLKEERIGRLRESDPLGEYARSLGLPYEAVAVRGRWDRGAMEALRDALKRASPELVHAHDVKASVYLQQASRGGRRLPFPVVSTHHGVEGRPDLLTRLYERVYRRYFLNSFDRVLCVSTHDRDLLAASVDARLLRLHLNGADGRRVLPEERAQASREARETWFPGEAGWNERILFGAVGRLSKEKDHARLFRVLSFLNGGEGARDWRCLVFGDGPLKESLAGLARRLDLERRIVWMGYRPGAASELAGLDLLLSFSRAEGLPVSLIEAGWAGTPVMATKVGGVKDVIPDESHGTWVAPEEPARESAERLGAFLTEDGAARLRAQGPRFQGRIARAFTQDRWARRLDEIYAGLGVRVGRRGTGPSGAPSLREGILAAQR